MTDETPLNPPDVALEDKGRELAGERAPEDQTAYIDQTDTDGLGTLTDTAIYEGELEAGETPESRRSGGPEGLEMLVELELREGETDDPNEAAEEGLAYVAPIDPPVVPSDDPQGAKVAAGFSVDALEDPYDEDHHSEAVTGEDEMAARVRDALRSDASTSAYADQIVIGTLGGRVVLRGMVDDLDDTDNVVAVAERVTGVVEVVDEIEVRALQ